jgi:hypothetical protein
MARCCALLLLAVAVTPVRAHFIWIVPDKLEEDRTTVRVIFSDSLEPDSPDLLAKIARTKLYVCGRDGRSAPLDLGDGKEGARIVTLEGKGPWEVFGECRYGVVQRGADKPFLLVYWPKTHVRRSSAEPLPHRKDREQSLEIAPVPNERATYDVLWKDEPLPGAEVAVVALGETKAREMKTDSHGRITLTGTKGGIYGIRARHVEDVQGTEDNKPYAAVRHYATLVVELSPEPSSGAAPRKQVPGEARAVANADPDATRLLAEARAARASWTNFPGFTADVVVNLDGHSVSRGRVEVKADGKVTLELGDKDAATWARRELGSIVGHRLGGAAEAPTPCAFADDEANPLGRAIRVLNDEYHSSYRIRDRQITVVNRAMPQAGIRFTITVLENRRNEEGNFLPVSFVVNTWDQKTNALQSSEAQHQTWVRVGKFDLPQALLVVTAKEGKQEARSLKLSNHQLLR